MSRFLRRSAGGISLALLLLTACASASAPPVDLPGWREIYRRPGWQAGPTVDLRAVGDVMLGRAVGDLIARSGAAAPFAHVGAALAGDLAVGNLESQLTTRRDAVRPGPYRLLADPSLASTLALVRFTAVGLANNHGLDAGPAGLADSLAALTAAGVAPLGAGINERAAVTPVILRTGGLRIALLAFNDVADPADGPISLAPTDGAAWANPDFAHCNANCPPGRAWLGPAALEAVAAARPNADVVVVLVHWGEEYVTTPSTRQQAWANRLVAAGADLILGAHPHVVQPAELVTSGGRAGFVAYSLGNFIFDGPPDPTFSGGMVLRVLLDRHGVALAATLPLDVTGGQPRPYIPPRPAASPTRASPTASGETPRPGVSPEAGDTAAWAWDGTAGHETPASPNLSIPPHPARLPVDLRGNGAPLWAELTTAGVVTLRDGAAPDAPLVWTNESPDWRFTRMVVGDPNDDGRTELLLLLWQRDKAGQLHSQPYLLGWRSGRYQIIWGGSATATPIQDFAVDDIDGDGRSELVVLEGGSAPEAPGVDVSVWRWHGWGFYRVWISTPGTWRNLGLADLNGDGRVEIVAAR